MKLSSRLIFTPLMLAALVGLSACVSSPAPEPQAESSPSSNVAVKKSPNDDRDYRYLELDNQLKVLLISDAKADKAAASLVVFRGSYDDPKDRPGLAHFLEHMLFIGTEKYPEPDGYFKFVQSNGGGSNAYTAAEHTNYFFDIQPSAFREGLDRFAQFFISPLFSKEYVDREKNAVHSEYKLQIKEDGWRGFAVQKVATNPAHPVSMFNIGTLDTLAGDVHADLLDFFENNYSANQMSLVVLSNEPLDELQPWVSEMFAGIKNRNLPDVVRKESAVNEDQIPATLRHDNIKETYGVSYVFPTPPIQPHYRKKPSRYLGNLLGHEGEGSLHKLLTEKGWINSLAAGESAVDDNNAIMTVSIDLTKAGANHVEEITGYLFAYLEMLRSRDIEAWLYEEQATVAELAFRFTEKSSAINAVRAIAPAMELYPAQELLIAPYLMEEFDAELIRDFLNHLTADNVIVTISSPGYEGQSTEQWFGVSYDLQVGPIEIETVDSTTLALPRENPFLPESLELVSADKTKPVAVISTDAQEIYLDTDIEFRVPRAVTHVSLRNPGGLIDLEDVAKSELYSYLVQDDLNALAYPALLAGVNYQIASPPKGFRVSIGGYHDKQLVLLEEVLQRLQYLDIDPERFSVIKGEVLRDLDNASKDRPYHQTYQRIQNELIENSWAPEQLKSVLQDLELTDLIKWRDKVLSQIDVSALIIGNVEVDRAQELSNLLGQRFELADVEIREPLVKTVSGANSVSLDVDHDDAAMVLYVQDDSDSFDDRARSTFLSHLIAPGYFASLRTEQQLGYVVQATNLRFRGRNGIGFIIQSPVAPPDELRSRTIAYVDSQVERLADMSQEEFGANKGGLIARITQREKNLSQRASRFWSDLDEGILTFDSRHQLAEAVSKLTLEDMQAMLEEVSQKLRSEYMMVYSPGKFGA